MPNFGQQSHKYSLHFFSLLLSVLEITYLVGGRSVL